jgi:hypothetical protein
MYRNSISIYRYQTSSKTQKFQQSKTNLTKNPLRNQRNTTTQKFIPKISTKAIREQLDSAIIAPA